MGTRADLWVRRGDNKLEPQDWIGSIAWDGYPSGLPDDVLKAKTEREFRDRVAAMAAGRDDWTKPEDGWPWPWEDSNTTDYAYVFECGRVMAFNFRWFPADEPEPDADDEEEELEEHGEFPNMESVKHSRWRQLQ